MKIQLDTTYMRKVIDIFKGRRNYRSLLMLRDSWMIYLHDKTLHRKSGPRYLKQAFKRYFKGDHEDVIYGLKEIEKHLKCLENFIDIVEDSAIELEEYAIHRLSTFMDVKGFKKVKGILYPFGRDGGFALLPNTFYMNVQTYKNDFESFKPVYAHEIYHARKRKLGKFIRFYLSQFFSNEKRLSKELGWIIEEGIASLVELGVDSEMTPLSAVTAHELECIEDHFNIVNMKILNDSNYHKKVEESINKRKWNHYLYKYQVGYYIAREVFLFAGKKGLDHWTENSDYKSVMRIYIESCRASNKTTYLDESIQKAIMKRTR